MHDASSTAVPQLLTVREVAESLRVGISTVYALIAQGKLAAFRIGPRQGGIRISHAALQDYLAGTRSFPAAAPLPRRRATLKHLKL